MRVLRHNIPTSADILELLWFPMAVPVGKDVFFTLCIVYSVVDPDPDPDPGAWKLAKSYCLSTSFCTYVGYVS
jgi:hypothetical protein